VSNPNSKARSYGGLGLTRRVPFLSRVFVFHFFLVLFKDPSQHLQTFFGECLGRCYCSFRSCRCSPLPIRNRNRLFEWTLFLYFSFQVFRTLFQFYHSVFLHRNRGLIRIKSQFPCRKFVMLEVILPCLLSESPYTNSKASRF